MKTSTIKILAFAVLSLTLISASSWASESIETQSSTSMKKFYLILARGGPIGGFPSGMGPGGLQSFKKKEKTVSKKSDISDDYRKHCERSVDVIIPGCRNKKHKKEKSPKKPATPSNSGTGSQIIIIKGAKK